uniref:Uncharacterized protein n=2 Tax=Salix viminalis TaxID=40686 RepID=A0A6N2MVB9_SALVM
MVVCGYELCFGFVSCGLLNDTNCCQEFVASFVLFTQLLSCGLLIVANCCQEFVASFVLFTPLLRLMAVPLKNIKKYLFYPFIQARVCRIWIPMQNGHTSSFNCLLVDHQVGPYKDHPKQEMQNFSIST